MSSSARRLKDLAAKRSRKAASFVRHTEHGPNPTTKYGKRQLARMAGQPMKSRPFPPWWACNSIIMFPELTRAQVQERSYQGARDIAHAVLERVTHG